MSKVRIFALGGLDEDGKNMFVIEIDDGIFILECGLKYPQGDQLGVEMIIPDFTYLKQNEKRIKGIFITHGHDDVMAALPSLMRVIKAPIYTAPLTAVLLEKRFKKEGIRKYAIHRIKRNSTFKIDNYEIKTFGVTQSIMDGFGVAIWTDEGYIVYTSEYIVDYDIKNEAFRCNLSEITKIGNEGVLALLTESVGSTREGHSAPKHRITSIIEPSFEDTNNRIIVTLYNQNIYRIIEVIELAVKYGRKICFYDDELKQMMSDIEKLGYYHVPVNAEITKANFNNDEENILVIISGSGSNIFKRVHKIAIKEDEFLEFRETDTIIIASPMVPGTEHEATKMENDLYKEGAKVIAVDSKRAYSMHAAIEDLKMMLYLFNPSYYVPVKGEYRQLVSNANIALDMGYKADHIIVLDNGQIATIEDGKLSKHYDLIELDDVMIDGKDNLDASGMVLRDREILSTDGVIVAGVVVNFKTKEIIGGPDVQSRGVIYLKDADYVMKEVGVMLENIINTAVKEKRYDNMACRQEAREKISRYVFKETGKKPMILPAIVEINIKG